jgi:hypothetical protein
MSDETTLTEAQIETIDVGDEIAWSEDWTSGAKQFRATVTDTGTTHTGNALLGTDREVRHFELELIEGDDSRFTNTPKLTAEEIEEVDNFEIATDDEDSESEIVTDGGHDDSAHMTDDDLADAIDHRGAPVTVAELRDIIGEIQRDIEAWWDEHMDTLEDGNLTVVHEDNDVIVFADHTGHFWTEQLDAVEIDDPETRGAVINAQHNAAKRLCDWSWSTSTPVVVAKPSDFNAGASFDHRHLMWLMDECGLSGGVALDYLMVEWHGLSQRQWSIRAGKDQGTISQNIAKAKDHVRR